VHPVCSMLRMYSVCDTINVWSLTRVKKEVFLMRHPCFMLLGLKIIWHVPNQGVIKCLILDCCQQCLDKVYRHIKTDSKDAFSSINTVVISTYQVLNSNVILEIRNKNYESWSSNEKIKCTKTTSNIFLGLIWIPKISVLQIIDYSRWSGPMFPFFDFK